MQGAEVPAPEVDRVCQREVVNAFFAAARAGDFAALIAVLHPDVVRRSDGGPKHPDLSVVVRGAAAVARQALAFAMPSASVRPALVNGAAGFVVTVDGRPFSVMGFTVVAGKIVEIDIMLDPDRLARLDLSVLRD